MKTNSVRFSYLAAVVGIAGLFQLYNAAPSAAAPNPDSCFTTSGVTDKTIDGYDVGGVGCGTDVEIPSTIGGESVVAIGTNAFSALSITSVVIPNSVTSIGDSAFATNQITSVTIPSSVTSIATYAFGENLLTSVIIPSSLTSIETSAFTRNQLTSVTIPSSVTSIGVNAFSQNQLTSVTIPSSVTSIDGSAFYGNKLTSVTIPNSVTVLGGSAFAANKLTSVTISNSVTTIAYGTFQGNQLTSVVIPDSVTSIEASAFANNQLTSVVIPDSVTSIGSGAFGFQSSDSEETFADYASGDPARIQEALNSMHYVRLYTESPSNPNGLQDQTVVYLMDVDNDGDDDGINFGGHLVNPSSVTLSFVDQNGQTLQAPQTVTSPVSSNYMVTAGPAIPIPADPFNPTPEESQAILDALAAYYRIGDTFTYTAPAIGGVSPAPTQYSFVLSASDVNPTRQFVYGATANTGTSNGSSLANTGLSLWAVVAVAVVLVVSSTIALVRR